MAKTLQRIALGAIVAGGLLGATDAGAQGCDPVVNCPLPDQQSHYFFDWNGNYNASSEDISAFLLRVGGSSVDYSGTVGGCITGVSKPDDCSGAQDIDGNGEVGSSDQAAFLLVAGGGTNPTPRSTPWVIAKDNDPTITIDTPVTFTLADAGGFSIGGISILVEVDPSSPIGATLSGRDVDAANNDNCNGVLTGGNLIRDCFVIDQPSVLTYAIALNLTNNPQPMPSTTETINVTAQGSGTVRLRLTIDNTGPQAANRGIDAVVQTLDYTADVGPDPPDPP